MRRGCDLPRYVRLEEEEDFTDREGLPGDGKLAKERAVCFTDISKTLSFDAAKDLVKVLVDLTCYQHRCSALAPLLSAHHALGNTETKHLMHPSSASMCASSAQCTAATWLSLYTHLGVLEAAEVPAPCRGLVSEALALLVRHFEQRTLLHTAGKRVQLLVKSNMIQQYSTFDELMRQLGLLASRRNLYYEELYQV